MKIRTLAAGLGCIALLLGGSSSVQAQDGVDLNIAELAGVEGSLTDNPEEALALPDLATDSEPAIQQFYNKNSLLENSTAGVAAIPLTLEEAEQLEADITYEEDDGALPFDIRKEAIKEAAISYGARAGLAWRTYYIRREMDRRARSLDRIYDFRQLLIPAPSGLLIEPPIISENVNSMIIEGDGQQAAVSDRIYNIMNNAKIVSAARTWRTYLEREWGTVEPPPDILRPRDAEERALWIKLVRRGWKEGVKQANEIFEQDLNQLVSDFEGMIRYRTLLAQGMVSAPYALQVDRGVTGGGDQMRVGDRAVQITGKPSLMTGYDTWQPASR